MNQVNFEPVFNDGEAAGVIISLCGFGMRQFIFRYEKLRQIRNWRNELDRLAGTMVVPKSGSDFDYASALDDINESENPELLIDKLDEYDGANDDVDIEFVIEQVRYNMGLDDFYIYAHKQNQEGGYVFIATKAVPGQPCKPKVDEQCHYPKAVYECGETEKFLYDYSMDHYYSPPQRPIPANLPIEKWPYWEVGDKLEIDDEILYLYFEDDTEWNELYWNLRNSIGRPWKSEDKLEVCVYDPREGYVSETEHDILPKTEAQKVVFWCFANGYSLKELYEMVETKTIIKHYRLLTEWY